MEKELTAIQLIEKYNVRNKVIWELRPDLAFNSDFSDEGKELSDNYQITEGLYKSIYAAIKTFKDNQTLANLQEVVNLGLKTKRLESNKWVDGWAEFQLPIEPHRVTTLYMKDAGGIMIPYAIAIY